MNELDLTTKIEGLKKAIAEHNDFVGNYTSDLTKAEQQLKDLNKPQLTPAQLDDIQEAIEKGVDQYDFSDTSNFDIEYGIEYDGKVHCESHELNCSYELIEMITEEVHKLFVEAECPEDELDTTELDNHKVTHVEKII